MATLEQVKGWIGREWVSEWRTITQNMVDVHAALTGDSDPIHNDVAWATKNTPFGGTIVQGFLTLGHFTWFIRHSGIESIDDAKYVMNYGFDKVRYVRPVLTGKPIRARIKLTGVDDRGTRVVLKHAITIEVEGAAEPSVVAEWLGSAQR